MHSYNLTTCFLHQRFGARSAHAQSTAAQRETTPIKRNSIGYAGFFTRRRIIPRPIQKPHRPVSQALIVKSRTRLGHIVRNIPIARNSKKISRKGIISIDRAGDVIRAEQLTFSIGSRFWRMLKFESEFLNFGLEFCLDQAIVLR